MNTFDQITISESVTINIVTKISVTEYIRVSDCIFNVYPGGTLQSFVVFGGSASSSESSQQIASSFVAIGTTIASVSLQMYKNGSPTDNVVFEITSAIDGSYVGSIGLLDSSTLTGSAVLKTITFSSPVPVTPGDLYYLRISRATGRDIVNHAGLFGTVAEVYSDGGFYFRNSNVWSEQLGVDFGGSINYVGNHDFQDIQVTDRAVIKSDVVTITENTQILIPTIKLDGRSNIVTNGSFTGSAAGWNLNSWTYAIGKVHTPGNADAIYQALQTVEGDGYTVEYDVLETNGIDLGSLYLSNNIVSGTPSTSLGHHSYSGLAGNDPSFGIQIGNGTGFVGSITNISVIPDSALGEDIVVTEDVQFLIPYLAIQVNENILVTDEFNTDTVSFSVFDDIEVTENVEMGGLITLGHQMPMSRPMGGMDEDYYSTGGSMPPLTGLSTGGGL